MVRDLVWWEKLDGWGSIEALSSTLSFSLVFVALYLASKSRSNWQLCHHQLIWWYFVEVDHRMPGVCCYLIECISWKTNLEKHCCRWTPQQCLVRPDSWTGLGTLSPVWKREEPTRKLEIGTIHRSVILIKLWTDFFLEEKKTWKYFVLQKPALSELALQTLSDAVLCKDTPNSQHPEEAPHQIRMTKRANCGKSASAPWFTFGAPLNQDNSEEGRKETYCIPPTTTLGRVKNGHIWQGLDGHWRSW